MNKPEQIISSRTKFNFYVNLLNFLPFVILIFSGMVIQINYHMHSLPDGYIVLGLNKYAWLLMHQISAVISLTGCIFHCILHWKYISAVTKNFINRQSGIKVFSSYYLLITGVLTTIPVILSWIFLRYNDHLRFIFVEIHDKLALLFPVFLIIHIISRTGWMVRTFNKIR